MKYQDIDYCFSLLDDYDYVVTCKAITDSLGSYVIEAPRREDYYLIQAPEAYKFQVLREYYDCNSDIYFAGNQMPPNLKCYRNYSVMNNIKLTTSEDKPLIEFLLSFKSQYFK